MAANVRCPMCSKINPPEAETCQFCGARLKPLRPGSASLPPLEPENAPEPGAGDDWLSELRGEPPEAKDIDAPVEPALPDDAPGWLARIRARAQTESAPDEQAAPEEQAAPGDFTGAWEQPGENATPQHDNLDDWLGRLPGSGSAPAEDWLSEPAVPDAHASADAASGSDWNWLQELEAADPLAAPPDVPAYEEPGMPGVLQQLDQPVQSDDLPAEDELHGRGLTDFLRRYAPPSQGQQGTAEPEAGETAPPELPTLPAFDGMTNDWPVAGVQPEPPAEISPESIWAAADWQSGALDNAATGWDPAPDQQMDQQNEEAELPAFAGEADAFSAVELPDWLSREAQPPVDLPEEAEAPIPQGDLPDWVKEMRPLEAVIPGEIPDEPAQQVERSGPLAGLRGILSAESALGHIRKPPTYSARLRVTERQREHANVLEDLLAVETRPLEAPARHGDGLGRLGRALLALFLLLALALPRLLAMAPLGQPALYPAELLDFHAGLQDALSSGSNVLVVVDFEPALAGEMRMAARPVIAHLMEKDAQLVIVSTTPGGPALAQDLLQTSAGGLRAAGGQYDLDRRAVNLGYLPGGSIALRTFADLPRQAAPASISGDPNIWQQGFLASIRQVQDFAQVVLLTDQAETARTWIEQVEPRMTAPLYVIASAQAAPLLAPYVETMQIDGMVSGALGGAMYQQFHAQSAGQPLPPQGDFAAYQFALLLSIFLVLGAGGVSALRGMARPGRRRRR